jgi:Tfp pilus assembly protein PilV
MTKQRLQSQAGFTLIEVGMASLILVVGFIGMIQAVTIGTQMLDTARKQQIAMQIIDGEIEYRRAGSLATLAALTSAQDYTITVDATGSSATGDTGQFLLSNNTLLLFISDTLLPHWLQ